jgi:hypothetical protein
MLAVRMEKGPLSREAATEELLTWWRERDSS